MRVPTIVELESIVLAPFPCGTDPCIDPIFGPTASSLYWSATSHATFPSLAWFVSFFDSDVFATDKFPGYFVRAVRGGL